MHYQIAKELFRLVEELLVDLEKALIQLHLALFELELDSIVLKKPSIKIIRAANNLKISSTLTYLLVATRMLNWRVHQLNGERYNSVDDIINSVKEIFN